jgi:predicted RNase H-like nuclease (RuvC/YqgF family)
VSQKATGPDARGASATTPTAGTPNDPAHALSAALKGLMATMHRQAERNTDVIDVFARALRDLDREVRDERMRREVLERRLRESEARMEELARVLHALARQGWVH